MKKHILFLFLIAAMGSCSENSDFNWDERVRIPNSFSPNDDGLNDSWCIDSQGVASCLLVLTDNDGMELWRTTDIHTCWIPQNTLSSNLYYYFLHAVFTDGAEHDYNGELFILN